MVFGSKYFFKFYFFILHLGEPPGLGLCHFPHSSFAQNHSFKIVTVSNFLRLLMTKEWLWANLSGCSPKMSDCEQFLQAAYQKWATVSKSLRMLMTKEQPEKIAPFLWENCSYAQKKSNSLIRTFLVSKSLTVAHFWWGICSQSLFFGEQSDRSSHGSLKKRDTSFLKLNKTYKKYDFVQIFWVNRSFFVSIRAIYKEKRSDLLKLLFCH